MNIGMIKICYFVFAACALAGALNAGDYAGAALITFSGFIVAAA